MNQESLSEIIQASQLQLKLLKNASCEGIETNINELESLFHEFEESGKELLAEGEVLQIGIVGQVKAGKSSFLNSLFFNGESILPKASTPMTAGLTVLEYAEKNTFEVEYFNEKDWDIFVNQDAEYQAREKEVRSANADAPESIIRKELERVTSEKVRSAHEMVSSCNSKAKGKIGKNNDVRDFCEIDDLQDILEQYVGANGEYTSVVKSLYIKMNDERLKGLRIVDTPGVNDPVVSRENRTRTFLQACHGVFLLSSSSDFLGNGDVAFLNSRIGGSGIGTVVLLASKFDSVLQDIGAELEMKREEKGDLVEIAEMQTKKFKKRLRELSDTIDEKLRGKIKVDTTSGIGYSIAHKPSAKWDDVERKVAEQMKRFYPDYFSTEQDIKESFEGLSNIADIREKYLEGTFMQNKEEIISEKVNAFFGSCKADIYSVISRMLEELELRKKQLNDTSIAEIQGQKDQQAKLFDNLRGKFSTIFNKFSNSIQSEIRHINNDLSFKEISQIPTETTSDSVTYKGWLWGHNTGEVDFDHVNTFQLRQDIETAVDDYGHSWNQAWRKLFEDTRNQMADDANKAICDFQKEIRSSAFDDVYYRNLIEKVLDNMQLNKELAVENIITNYKRQGADIADEQFYPSGTDELKEEQVASYLAKRLREHNKQLIGKFRNLADGIKYDMKTEIDKNLKSAISSVESMKSSFAENLKKEGTAYLEMLEKDLLAKTEVLKQIDGVITNVKELAKLYK